MLSGPRHSWFKPPSFRLEWTLETPSSYSLFMAKLLRLMICPSQTQAGGSWHSGASSVTAVFGLKSSLEALLYKKFYCFAFLKQFGACWAADRQFQQSAGRTGVSRASRPHSGTQEGGGRERTSSDFLGSQLPWHSCLGSLSAKYLKQPLTSRQSWLSFILELPFHPADKIRS